MTEPRPERIAAVARALGLELRERLALYADAIAESLERDLGLVAWDRQQIIGQVQAGQWRLREERFRQHGGSPIRIIERRLQPLECVGPCWRALRMGRRVRVEHEAGAARGALEILRGMAREIGSGVLTVPVDPLDPPDAPAPEGWEDGGVALAHPRVALLDEDADPELAAYVLARSCLRRGGMDPRAVRRALVVGRQHRLERHLRRLWYGARFGSPSDPTAFAGPVDGVTRDAYLDACRQWREHPETEVLCEGGILERAGDPGIYLAPTLLRVAHGAPDLPLAGPLLVLVEGEDAECREAFSAAGARGEGRLQIAGGQRREPLRDTHGEIRRIQGALLADRLPPGLPEPRPV